MNFSEIKKVFSPYWKDPVWSKVIAAGIITLLSILGSVLYSTVILLVNKVAIYKTLERIWFWMISITEIPVYLIVGGCFLFLVFTVKPVFDFTLAIYKKVNSSSDVSEEFESKPFLNGSSSEFFSGRMAETFPGQRGTIEITCSRIAVRRLILLLSSPLSFTDYNSRIGSFERHPVWWYRGNSDMYIEHVRKLSRGKILMNYEELKIKRIIAHRDTAYYKDYVYVECYPNKKSGIYRHSREYFEHCKSNGEPFREEFAVFKFWGFFSKKITRSEYDDAASHFWGRHWNTHGAELRVRHLTPYNFVIAANDSSYNSNRFHDNIEPILSGILTGKKSIADLANFMSSFTKGESSLNS